MNLRFKKGDRVKVGTNGEIGTVEYCSTDWTSNEPFYRVKFADGRTEPIAERDLLPA